MMRIWLFVAALSVMAAGCGAATPAPPTEEPTAAEAPAAGTGATVKAGQHARLGTILTDAEGRTLYIFTNDEPGVSNCTGGCASAWPPLTTQGEPQAGQGVDAGALGTIERPDGTTQVTYKDQPLYRYGADINPGDANGQGVGGVWFVITPEGSGAEDAEQRRMDDYSGGY